MIGDEVTARDFGRLEQKVDGIETRLAEIHLNVTLLPMRCSRRGTWIKAHSLAIIGMFTAILAMAGWIMTLRAEASPPPRTHNAAKP